MVQSKRSALQHYREKERVLWAGPHPCEIRLNGPEFLLFISEHRGIDEAELCKKFLKPNRYFVQLIEDSGKNTSLSEELARALAELTQSRSFGTAQEWQKKTYAVSLSLKGELRIDHKLIPTLDFNKSIVLAANPGDKDLQYRTKLSQWVHGHTVEFTPWEFMKWALQLQQLPESEFSSLFLSPKTDMHAQFLTSTAPFSYGLAVQLAYSCDRAPYDQPVFWRQKSFTVGTDTPIPQFDCEKVRASDIPFASRLKPRGQDKSKGPSIL